jgi:hypothetical protein
LGHAGPDRGRDGPDAPGARRRAEHRRRKRPALDAQLAGGGLSARRASPGLYRLKGDLLLEDSGQTLLSADQGRASEAEACFRQALGVTRRQEAKSLELRAAMSLSRLWQWQGKRHEARELLASIYEWFTEAFDTADLQEAKGLLAELS